MSTFKHFGVPTGAKMDGMAYLEGGKVWYTDPEASAYNIEFLYFESDSPMPDALKTQCHAAFLVDDLAAAVAVEGQTVVIEPFEVFPGLRIAFVLQDAALIELMEETK